MELIIPPPHTQALIKPLKVDVYNSPTLCVKAITPTLTLAFIVKIFRLLVFKAMNIMPLFCIPYKDGLAIMLCKNTHNFSTTLLFTPQNCIFNVSSVMLGKEK